MEDLEQALQRLTQAVAKLEGAMRGGDGAKSSAKAAAAPIETPAMVAARLDDAIARIDRLLET